MNMNNVIFVGHFSIRIKIILCMHIMFPTKKSGFAKNVTMILKIILYGLLKKIKNKPLEEDI